MRAFFTLHSLFSFLAGMLYLASYCPSAAYAQHPVEVQQAYASTQYVESLSTAYQMARKRDTVESTIAAARSAWALGLPDEAQKWFQKALIFPGLSSDQQADILFSLAIVLFSQRRLDEARLYAQRASLLAKDNPILAAQSLMLLGDLHYDEKRFGQAEREYVRALRFSNDSLNEELYFRLGKVHFDLGNKEQSAEMLMRLSLSSPRLPEALRVLAQIDATTGNFAKARTVLEQARERFPDQFLDSWVELIFLRAAIEDQNQELVRTIRDEAKKKFPAGDPWLVLLDGEAESWLWTSGRSEEGRL